MWQPPNWEPTPAEVKRNQVVDEALSGDKRRLWVAARNARNEPWWARVPERDEPKSVTGEIPWR